MQLLFFDLDDTLLDHAGAEEAAQRETVGRFANVFNGVPFDTWLGHYRTVNTALWHDYGRGEIDRHHLHRERFARPLAALGLDPGHASTVGEHYMTEYRRHWRLNDGAEEILEDAARLGVVGVVSNGFRDTQRLKIKRFGLDRWVKHVILSEDVGSMKPGREIFDAALRAAGGVADRKIYVGDSFESDVIGAKKAGWMPVLYNPTAKKLPAPVLYVRKLVDLKPLLE